MYTHMYLHVLRTEEMNNAMAKLNSILNPNKQSPEELQELEEKADGVLKRIKDQLHEAGDTDTLT